MTEMEISGIKQDLVEKTKRYEEITGISTEKLVEKLLTEFFEDIHITNDYINIDDRNILLSYCFINGYNIRL